MADDARKELGMKKVVRERRGGEMRGRTRGQTANTEQQRNGGKRQRKDDVVPCRPFHRSYFRATIVLSRAQSNDCGQFKVLCRHLLWAMRSVSAGRESATATEEYYG